MIEGIIQFIHLNAHLAHWFIFGGIVLAALHFPISLDLMLILGATLAATIIPENFYLILFSIYFGCIISSMISYWVGRLLGPRLLRIPFFSKLLNQSRMETIKTFYQKYGLYTLIVGRFIPFGARNCIFMSTGLSKISFPQFVLRDAIASAIWTGACFSLVYTLGKNFETIYYHFKIIGAILFSALSVTGIVFFWYRRKKKSVVTNV